MRMSVYRCKCAKTEVLELAALKMRGYAEVGGKAFCVAIAVLQAKWAAKSRGKSPRRVSGCDPPIYRLPHESRRPL